MGDLNIVGDSIHLNLMNPASYSNLKTTTLAIGGTSIFNKLKTNSDNEGDGMARLSQGEK